MYYSVIPGPEAYLDIFYFKTIHDLKKYLRTELVKRLSLTVLKSYEESAISHEKQKWKVNALLQSCSRLL